MEGWVCPRCQKVYAPWVRECNCNPPYRDTITYPIEPTNPWVIPWSPFSPSYTGNPFPNVFAGVKCNL